MIIRRIVEGMRHQDWATVLVEFVIVVVGIFVGLQANNWNEARLDRAQESENLERLLVEAEEAVGFISAQVELGADRIESLRELLQFLFSDDPLPADTSSMLWGHISTNFFPAIAPTRATYDELTASGGLRLIRSERVRESIARYYAGLDLFDAQLAYFRDFSNVVGSDPDYEARDYIRGVYEPGAEFGRRYVIDWEGLRADPYLGSLYVDKLRHQIVMNRNRQDLMDHATNMCDELATEVGRPCTPVTRPEMAY